MMESGFIYNILQDDTDIYKQEYLTMLDIKQRYGFMIVLEFGDGMENGAMTNAVGANVRVNKYYSRLKEIVKDYFECITGPIMGNRVVLFVPFDRDKADYEERVPAAPQSGCSRKRPELETVTPATAIPLSPPAARQSPGVQAQARPAGAL